MVRGRVPGERAEAPMPAAAALLTAAVGFRRREVLTVRARVCVFTVKLLVKALHRVVDAGVLACCRRIKLLRGVVVMLSLHKAVEPRGVPWRHPPPTPEKRHVHLKHFP